MFFCKSPNLFIFLNFFNDFIKTSPSALMLLLNHAATESDVEFQFFLNDFSLLRVTVGNHTFNEFSLKRLLVVKKTFY